MKTFLACYVSWIIAIFLFLTFFSSVLSNGQHFFLVLLFLALLPAIITYLFYRQSEEIDALKARLDQLEGREKKEEQEP